MKKAADAMNYALRYAYNFITNQGKEKFSKKIRETSTKPKEVVDLLKQNVIKTLTDGVGGLWIKKERITHFESFKKYLKKEFENITSKINFSDEEKKQIIIYIINNIDKEFADIKVKDEEAIKIIKNVLTNLFFINPQTVQNHGHGRK